MNIYNIISMALAKIGAVAPGVAPSARDAQLAVQELNNMLYEWSSKSIYTNNQTNQVCPANGTNHITMGTDANGVPGDMPVNYTHIYNVTIELGTTVWSVPVRTLSEYNSVFPKNTAGVPKLAFWDYDQHLQSKLYLWPIIPASYNIRVLGIGQTGTADNAQSDLNIPEIYTSGLVSGLAVRLIPYYNATFDPNMLNLIEKQAHSAMTGIKRMNNNMRNNDVMPDFKPNSNPSNYWNWPGRTT